MSGEGFTGEVYATMSDYRLEKLGEIYSMEDEMALRVVRSDHQFNKLMFFDGVLKNSEIVNVFIRMENVSGALFCVVNEGVERIIINKLVDNPPRMYRFTSGMRECREFIERTKSIGLGFGVGGVLFEVKF